MPDKIYLNSNNNNCFLKLNNVLEKMFLKHIKNSNRKMVFLCIGTDRSTGDSLGPLIGYKLSSYKSLDIPVYGTLNNPVHAKNLERTISVINKKHNNPFVVAIDASLGGVKQTGYITVGYGSINPGSGVSKQLPSVGEMFITGIVNIGGYMDFLVLQNTRLATVMSMADLISSSIIYTMTKISKDEDKYTFVKA